MRGKTDLLSLLYGYLILRRINGVQNDCLKKKEKELQDFVMTEEDLRTLFKDPDVRSVINEIADDSLISALDEKAEAVLKKHFNALVEKAETELKKQQEAYDSDKGDKALSLFEYSRVDYVLPSGKTVTADDFQLGEAKFKELKDSYNALRDSHLNKLRAERDQLLAKKAKIDDERIEIWYSEHKITSKKAKAREIPLRILSIIFFLAAVVWIGISVYCWIIAGKFSIFAFVIWLIPSAIAGYIAFLLYCKAELVVPISKKSNDYRKEEYDEIEKKIADLENQMIMDGVPESYFKK